MRVEQFREALIREAQRIDPNHSVKTSVPGIRDQLGRRREVFGSVVRGGASRLITIDAGNPLVRIRTEYKVASSLPPDPTMED